MHLPVDYLIRLSDEGRDRLKHKEKLSVPIVFRMLEVGYRSMVSNDDKLEIAKRLFLAYAEHVWGVSGLAEHIEIRRAASLQLRWDFTSYDVIKGLGPRTLRIVAAGEREPVRTWMIQEAGIMELDDD